MKRLWKRLSFWFNRVFYPSNMKITGHCLQCGQCCLNLIIVHDGEAIRDPSIFAKIKHTDPFYQNITFNKVCDAGFARFSCNYLVDHRCSIYKSRPEVCKHYPSVAMFKHGGHLLPGCGYHIEPRKPFSFFLENSS
ncbi:MAG TPA: YkgJ family cysteine cluster protein [Candidatus Cloacimonadota bacterium]|nr:YkgJ family cysteine cluster protein [Candidatus Cloacimonadales bacterium]HPY96608.1 YkgJ family cysteine cluster protein [Candidatus Cloacimonadota bacterium]HQB40966.1 YkgJ family cysteine cluster protein [Candidatus Cloacimonadota bacterium]